MARINLLPWREALRKEKQRAFITLTLLSCALMGVLVFYLHIHVGGLIDTQNARNDFLTQQIDGVDKEIAEIQNLEKNKGKLLTRMEVIQRLQASRPDVVRLFDGLVRLVPEGIYLTRLARHEAASKPAAAKPAATGADAKGKPADDKQKEVEYTLEIDGVAQTNARVSALMRNLDNSPWFKSPTKLIVTEAITAKDVDPKKVMPKVYKFSLEVTQVVSGEDGSTASPTANPGKVAQK